MLLFDGQTYRAGLMRKQLTHRIILILDLFACIVMIMGSYALSQKAGTRILVDELLQRSEISTLTLNDTRIRSVEHVEFLVNGLAIGTRVSLKEFDADAKLKWQDERVLGQYYSETFLILNAAVAILFVVLALFVFLKSPKDIGARVFHHLSISIAVLLCVNPGYRDALPPLISIVLRLSFCLSYAFVPLWLLSFSLVFPRVRTGYTFAAMRWIWGVAGLFALGMLFGVEASIWHSQNDFQVFEISFMLCRILFLSCVVLSVVQLLKSYSASGSKEERAKTLWVLLGYTTSVFSFALLWVLPQVLFHQGWMDESWVTVLIAVAPITFAIAIVRYRLLDIDVIVNRGAVYGIVIALILGLYAVLITIVVSLYGRDFSTLQWILPAIIVLNVLLFAPARGLVQRFVDQTFFRVQYNFRNTQRGVLERLSHSLTPDQLAETVVHEVQAVLQPERCVVIERQSNGEFVVVASEGFEADRMSLDQVYDTSLFVGCYSMLADGADTGTQLCLGPKKSGLRYSDEDVDLVVSLTSRCGAILQRFSLQKAVLREHLESKRLTELNELKSYFVSSVTHDLKTPLTSIKMFAEMLHSHVSGEKAQTYLHIIEGESDRLTRLINNVLDYSKIERGVKEYHFSNVEIHEVIEAVIGLMEYQMELGGFALECDLRAEAEVVSMDRDAFIETLVNLLSNAMKYSLDEKSIHLSCYVEGNEVVVSVADKGIGIESEDLERMLDPFVRLGSQGSNRVGGAGLGLALVKHFVDAHTAKIHVESTVGKGTCIQLRFSRGVVR